MANRTIAEIRKLVVEQPLIISYDATLKDATTLLVANPVSRHVYVVDNDNILKGSIRLHDLIEIIFPYLNAEANLSLSSIPDNSPVQKLLNQPARSFMNDTPLAVLESNTLTELIPLLIDNSINELPVIEESGKIIGEVNLLEILKAISN